MTDELRDAALRCVRANTRWQAAKHLDSPDLEEQMRREAEDALQAYEVIEAKAKVHK